MEIALHLRTPDQKQALSNTSAGSVTLSPAGSSLTALFFNEDSLGKENWERKIQSFDRIYVGDEFCSNRLPMLTEMEQFSDFAEEKNLSITLLTPVLTDDGIEKCSPLFEYLKERHPMAEVVVNDLGVLFYVRKNYPLFRLAAGRLFNKGFKDPRLSDTNEAYSIPSAGSVTFSGEAKELLSDCTFDHAEFQEKIAALSVIRLERDLMPYSGGIAFGSNFGQTEPAESRDFGLKTSVYFPFGYVTTGRICWTASFRQPPEKRFVPPGQCSRPCDTLTMKLENKRFSFPMIQNGNTIFYLYSQDMLNSLMKKAEHENLRLVWQGLVFGNREIA